MDNNLIQLSGGKIYITKASVDAFRVLSGEVLVYILPIKNNEIGRRSFFYKAKSGEIIPGFSFEETEGIGWHFCFSAVESANIEIIENGSTKVLRDKFAKKADIKNYQMEGFNGGLLDLYKSNTVSEDSFIIKSQRDREKNARDILNLIRNSFNSKQKIQINSKSGKPLYDCVAMICKKRRFQIAPYEKIKQACGENFQLSDIARISHFSFRKVILETDWYKSDQGEMIAFLGKEKKPVVLIPTNKYYNVYNPETGLSKKVTKADSDNFDVNAFLLYKPLPKKELHFRDVFSFCTESLRATDVLLLIVMSVITALIGLITPIISQKLYDEYLPIGDTSVLFQLGGLMCAFLLADIMFTVVKNLTQYKISSRIAFDFQNSVFDRLFNFPESFFRQYESADLARRVLSVNNIAFTYVTVIATSTVALVNFIIYLVRMGLYSARLMVFGILIMTVYSVLYYITNVLSIKYNKKCAELDGKTSSIMYQFINGISKIRMAGVEDRAAYEFLKPYTELRNNKAKAGKIVNIGHLITIVADGLISVIFYIIIVKSGIEISIGSFIAFNSVFGLFSALVIQIMDGIIQIVSLKPNINRLKPIFDTLPEYDEAKELPGDITGEIEINNVTFSYSEDSPNVLDGLSLEIHKGEYLGIVGASGCGKSTLLKLLLGFEKPKSGKIYYDNKDIESLDKRELRKKIGVVLQDGKLISGSIFENITITNPSAGKKDVDEVIRAVGLKADIDEMPMGLNTVLGDNCVTISGGQQQRILIARALISKPQILFFDEATSALDNITQKMVCDTFENIPATKVVIAHRLSTVINCDRIIVFDKGKISEQGTYSELMEKQGLFWQFASRQMA